MVSCYGFSKVFRGLHILIFHSVIFWYVPLYHPVVCTMAYFSLSDLWPYLPYCLQEWLKFMPMVEEPENFIMSQLSELEEINTEMPDDVHEKPRSRIRDPDARDGNFLFKE